MSLPTLAVRRPITIAMALASVLLFGSIALSRLPLAFLPAVDVPFIFVQIPYPNANPAQIEREITKPVEEVLATLSGVKKMRATSTADEAQLRLEFNWGEDLDVVRMQVSEKLDQIAPDLPEGTGEILIFSFNTTDIPVVEARIGATGVDLSESYPLIESRIVNRLRRLPGVARVDLDGVEPREIFIDLEIDKIKAYRVDVGNLIGRLQAAAGNQVLGEVSQDGMRYTARSLGDFDSVDAVRRLPIDENGLVLEDVAEISYEEPPIAWGRHLNLNDAVALLVFKESTANTVDVVRDVMATIDGDISEDPLLKGVDVFVWNDQGEQITNAVDGLTKSGLIGALMAIVVLYFFLRRIRPTLIVSLSIPFSIIAACGVLYFMGKSLNVLSMMGLMLGVGMLVDNAIVVLESIDRTSRDVPDKAEAASRGATHVWLAVLASTATSLIVFLPLVVGSKSELSTWLGEIGLTICLALVCSLVSSLTLIPMAASKFLPPAKDVKPFAILVWLEDRYAAILGWTLRRPRATFGVLTIILVIGFLPFFIGMVDANMFSGGVNKRMYLRYDFVDFAYKSRAEATVDQVEAVLWPRLEEFEIESIYSYFRSNEAGTTLTVARDDMSDEEFKALRGELREILPTIPGVRLVFDNDNDSGGDSTFFSVNFFGQDVDELTRIAGEARRRLETVDGMFDVSTSLDRGRREVEVEIDRAKAARLGMTAQDVTEVVGFALGGVRLPRFNAGDREVDTWLALRLEDRSNIADLSAIRIGGEEDRGILLGDVANFKVVERAQAIDRENRKVRVAVRGTFEGEDWDAARAEIEGLVETLALPAGYSWSWNDRIIEQDTQGQQMGINMLLAILLVYLVMASLFESLAQPFAILFSIPFALPGVAWMLGLTGTPFNLMSQIGILILMGIVVNNGIVLLDHMNQLRQNGLDKHAAVIQAGRDRMRAILMTASTTIIGLLPLALGGSKAGGLFYYPLALTVMGGLISSAFLTLLVLPYLALRVEAISSWMRNVWLRSGRKPKTLAKAVAATAVVSETSSN